jgi:uncharacterized RDD family membrane protein YckC
LKFQVQDTTESATYQSAKLGAQALTTTIEGASLQRPDLKSRAATQKGRRLHAPFSLRCGALLIDYILLISIVAFSTLIARMLGGGARAAAGSAETLGILMSVFAAIIDLGILPGLTGFTIGKWATGLRIEPITGGKISIGTALLRHFVGYPVSFLPLGIGFLIAAFTARGRTLHDLIAGTVVARAGTPVPATTIRQSQNL